MEHYNFKLRANYYLCNLVVVLHSTGGLHQPKGNILTTEPTVIVRLDWAQRAAKDAGGVVAWAQALGIDKSTASRHLRGGVEASPRFIAAVLRTYPVTFDAAFDVIDRDREVAA